MLSFIRTASIKKSFGIFYAIRSLKNETILRELEFVIHSAKSVRAQEPEVPIILISSTLSLKAQSLSLQTFNALMLFPSEILSSDRVEISRPEAMSLSPFDTTLWLDTGLYACTPFVSDLLQSTKEAEVDLAFTGVDPYHVYPIQPDPSVIFYKSNTRMRNLLNEWRDDILLHNQEDKKSLKTILHANYFRASAGRLTSTYNYRFRPAEGEPWMSVGDNKRLHDQTLLVSGSVRILNMREHQQFPDAVCEATNLQSEAPRVMVWDKINHARPNKKTLGDDLPIAYSQEECESLLGSPCLKSDWNLVPEISVLGIHLQVLPPDRLNESLSRAKYVDTPARQKARKLREIRNLIEKQSDKVPIIENGKSSITVKECLQF